MRKGPPLFCFLVFFLLVLEVPGVFASQLSADTAVDVHAEGKTPTQERLNTKPLQIRSLNSRALDTYSQQPEFQYVDTKDAAADSWWTRFWRSFWRWLSSLREDSEPEEATSPAWNYVIIAAFVAVVLYLAIKYMHLENFFRKTPETIAVPYSESLKNIHEISFDRQISEAIEKRNFKIAVRLHYLSVLKRLNDAGLIAWQPDKPNSVYLQELREKKYQEPFGLLTRQFEYVWYGDFPLGEPAFRNIDRLFADFKKTLP